MKSTEFSWTSFNQLPIVGIVRNMNADLFSDILPIYLDAGFSTIEVTMNSIGATNMIKEASTKFAGLLNIGAGTVCTLSDLNEALNAGANFIVTPIVVKEVIEECVRLGVPVFPGAFTPTEIYTAWSLGASIVKVFPASSMGPDYISAIKAPLSQIKLMPTGGINAELLIAYKKAGADALGIGSPLFSPEIIKTANWNQLSVHLKDFKNKWELN